MFKIVRKSPFFVGAFFGAPTAYLQGEVTISDSEEHWEVKKKTCSFCKTMLESPCENTFKKWSLCIDKAMKGTLFITMKIR